MGAIFVSYRRGDSEGQARALSIELGELIGKDSVFMDVDSIALGRDFRLVLQERLASCDLMLALIGPDWLEIKDSDGNRRLDSPTDFVRQEIGAALKRNIPVTPVLVQGAQMPAEDRLPEDLKDLAFRNGFELSHTRWESDVRELVKRLGLSTRGSDGSTVAEVPSTGSTSSGSGNRESDSARTVSTGTGDGSVRARPSSGWSKVVLGAAAMLVLLVVLGYFLDSEDSSAPQALSERQQWSAYVTATEAEFVFPVDAEQTWRWNLTETPAQQDEYLWSVRIPAGESYEFQIYSEKEERDRPAEGDLKALLGTTFHAIFRGVDSVPEEDLSVEGTVEANSLILTVTGPELPTVFASHPQEATFEVITPGAPKQSWTVPIDYE